MITSRVGYRESVAVVLVQYSPGHGVSPVHTKACANVVMTRVVHMRTLRSSQP